MNFPDQINQNKVSGKTTFDLKVNAAQLIMIECTYNVKTKVIKINNEDNSRYILDLESIFYELYFDSENEKEFTNLSRLPEQYEQDFENLYCKLKFNFLETLNDDKTNYK